MASPLCNRIAEIRKTKGITQQKLADKLGILRTSLSAIENEKYGVTATMMKSISDALQEPLGAIFFNPDVSNFDTEKMLSH